MPDISMCDNQSCDCRQYCYRFTALSSGEMQAYTRFEPPEDGSRCEGFWGNRQYPPAAQRVPDYPGMTAAEEGNAA